jgi:HNH endonuclease
MKTWEERFFAKVTKIEGGCWLWTGAVNSGGYGQFRLGKTQSNAHRILYEQLNGPVSADLLVCHSCNVSHCVNPDHLYVGTIQENDAYRDACGRHRNGGLGKLDRIFPLPPKRPVQSLPERFWSKVQKTDGCWLWLGRKIHTGYGQFDVTTNIVEMAHRIAWQLTNGTIPKGLKVLHRCDCRACVRPDHLFLGTQAENVADCESKGRGNHPKGEQQGQSKLTEAQVREIRQLYQPWKMPYYVLGKRYGVSAQVIFSVVKRKTWKHLI